MTKALLLAGAVVAVLAAGLASAPARGEPVAACTVGSVKAPIGGKRVCLRAGQPCVSRFAVPYRRYGFDCVKGWLRSRWMITDLAAVGDGGARAIDEQGRVLLQKGNRYRGYYLWQNGVLTDLSPLATDVHMNAKGQIYGFAFDSPSSSQGHYLLWQDGVLTNLGGFYPLAINNRGQMVGYRSLSDHRAVLWDNGVVTDLGTLGESESKPILINDRTQVVVEQTVATDGWHWGIWENGVLTDHGDTVIYTGFRPGAINAKGQIAGVAYPTETSQAQHAFLWENGVLHDLGSLGDWSGPTTINGRGQITGQSLVIKRPPRSNEIHAFLWQNGHMQDIGPNGGDSWALINDSGQIAGSRPIRSGYHAVVWEKRQIVDLPVLPRTVSSGVTGINNHDQIIGYTQTKTGQRHAILWTPRHGT